MYVLYFLMYNKLESIYRIIRKEIKKNQVKERKEKREGRNEFKTDSF